MPVLQIARLLILLIGIEQDVAIRVAQCTRESVKVIIVVAILVIENMPGRDLPFLLESLPRVRPLLGSPAGNWGPAYAAGAARRPRVRVSLTRRGDTPVPIPNTEVKPSSADGSSNATLDFRDLFEIVAHHFHINPADLLSDRVGELRQSL